ncbi:hypothetical protein Thiosp_02934 [Thiorhodovibrio litoralis]|nr:hypothetical protein Thiosp_02934 [Thiorhodovibrio litoralis]
MIFTAFAFAPYIFRRGCQAKIKAIPVFFNLCFRGELIKLNTPATSIVFNGWEAGVVLIELLPSASTCRAANYNSTHLFYIDVNLIRPINRRLQDLFKGSAIYR